MDKLKEFTKKALSVQEQIEILSNRGLIITDRDIVSGHLSTVSYYRLSAYFKPFQLPQDQNHLFKPNVTFENIWKIYLFDKELRLHVSDALERIEIALRTSLSNVLSIKYGNLWYLSEEPFRIQWSEKKPSGFSQYTHFKKEIDEICKNKKEEFISHYLKKYNEPPYPPSWMLMECLSFGKITSLFRNLSALKDKKAICDVFNYHPRVIESTLESLRYMRNLCAHHSRVWNRWFLYAPRHLNSFGNFTCSSSSFKMQAFIIYKLNKSISQDSQWLEKLHILFEKYSENIDFALMGFLENWENDPLWSV